jgi:hypothetical protein
MDGKTAAIREEGQSGDFYFYFHANGGVCLWGRSGMEAHHRASERN